jgi:hypothetical protein
MEDYAKDVVSWKSVAKYAENFKVEELVQRTVKISADQQ